MDVQDKKLLPIGTVVLLKDADKKLMITGYYPIVTDSKKIYDYCGCLYPEGYLTSNSMALFNVDLIDKVFFMGYDDEDRAQFKVQLEELAKKIEEERKEEEKNTDFEEVTEK